MSNEKPKVTVTKDTVLKDFWNNNDCFADLINAYLYNGENVVSPDELVEMDTDMSSIVEFGKILEGVKGARDVLKAYKYSKKSNVAFVILGIENQCYIDYAMPARVLMYDAINYNKQIRKIKNIHEEENEELKKKEKDLTQEQSQSQDGKEKENSEFMSLIKKTDKIAPVYTIVIYYGDKPWDGPVSLHEMFDPEAEAILPYINDYPLNLIEANDNQLVFHNKKNEALFAILKILFNKSISSAERRKEAIQYVKEHNTRNDVIIAAARAAGSQADYSNISQDKKGEEIMCELFEDLKNEGRKEGREEGREEERVVSIRKMIKNLDCTIDKAFDTLEIPEDERILIREKLAM